MAAITASTDIVTNNSTRVKPWMTGKSRVTTAFRMAEPMPGTAKMYSIVTWMPIM